jgi:hypothetical protein
VTASGRKQPQQQDADHSFFEMRYDGNSIMASKRLFVSRATATIGVLISLVGCVMDVAITQPDPYFKTDVELAPDEIHEWNLIDLASFQDVLYVRRHSKQTFSQPFTGGLPTETSTLKGQPATWIESESVFEEYLRASLENIGYFRIVERIDDVAIHSVVESGDSLIAEYLVDWQGGYDYIFHLRMINPSTGEILLHLSHYHERLWPRLDRPLFNPVFNGLIDWKNECLQKYREQR